MKLFDYYKLKQNNENIFVGNMSIPKLILLILAIFLIATFISQK